MTRSMSERFLSTGDVADMLHVSEATVKRWSDAGMLACIRTPGGHRKFRLRDVAIFIELRREPGDSSLEPLTPSNEATEELVRALLVGDIDKVASMVSAAHVLGSSFAQTADAVVVPALRRVRDAATQDRCEPFHEHLARNTILEVCARLRTTLSVPGVNRGRIVAACLPSDRPGVFAWLSSLVGVEKGFDTYVLGNGLSAHAIARAADGFGASWVVLASDSPEITPATAPYVTQVLGSTSRSRARVACVGLNAAAASSEADGIPDAVLSVATFRDLEGVLAPVALRVSR